MTSDAQGVEMSLNSQLDLLREYWDFAPEARLLFDSSDRLLMANPAADNLLGLSRAAQASDTNVGAHLSEILPPVAGHVMLRAKQTSQSVRSLEPLANLKRPGLSFADGSPSYAQVRFSACPLTNGASVLMIDVIRQAPGQDRAWIHQLSALLAHELRNPISGIRGAAQLMEEKLGEQDQELARWILEECDRIGKLADQWARLGQDGDIEIEAFEIHQVIEKVLRPFDTGTKYMGQLRRKFDPSLPPVSGNAALLEQALTHLLTNATEALEGQEDAMIEIVTRYETGLRRQEAGRPLSALLRICDNGPGIPPHLISDIFQPFVTQKKGGPRGLGLALAQSWIHDMKGRLELEPSDVGASFAIFLPLARVSPT